MKAPSAQHVLAVETATAWQSVALLQDERVLALAEQDAEGSHARSLMGAIDRVLRETGLGLRDVQGLAVSIGPGSFTGLRVGLATMLGFRAVLGTPIAPVPTLEAMAWSLREVNGLLVPVLKSRHNEVYWAAYEWLPGPVLHTRMAEQVGPPSSVARAVQGAETSTLFGDGWQAYGQEIRQAIESIGGKIQEATPEQQRPSAVSVALAARRRVESGQLPEVNIVPLYVQRTEAEVKFDEQQGVSALERRRERVAKKLAQGRRRVSREGADPRARK
ncbi:MAG: tRNA (adenosine(37)-N6)-threonylcarbamoyltransferase complex dimerization subunit type 1 TsaB [Nitrospira defluvii]|nr:tRNA (adenosine(37)-N6)-threonylcarbamoyltransferase complex dimerization subunit type 1 TsaB [Nitrospira defluvii]